MSKNTTKTINASYNELLRNNSMPFVPRANTLLNHNTKWANISITEGVPTILLTESAESTVYPITRYVAIGRGGKNINTGSSFIEKLKHNPANPRLKEHIPVFAVSVDDYENDILNNEGVKYSRYRLRVTHLIGTISYHFFFLMVVDSLNTETPEVTVIKSEDGVNTTEINAVDFAVENISYMADPAMTEVDNTTSNLGGGFHALVKTTIELTLDQTDVRNVIEACNLLYNNVQAADISEVALVSATDYAVTGEVPYTEVINAQVMHFIATDHPLYDGLELTLRYGLANSAPWFERSA